MNKTLTTCLIAHLLFSPVVLAKLTPLERLSEIPATQLEFGMFKVDILTKEMTQTHGGKRVPNTRFEYKDFTYTMKPNKITVLIQYQAKSKFLTQDNCKILQDVSNKTLPKSKLMSLFNTNSLTKSEKKEFHYLFEVRTRLVDKNNATLTFKCT